MFECLIVFWWLLFVFNVSFLFKFLLSDFLILDNVFVIVFILLYLLYNMSLFLLNKI